MGDIDLPEEVKYQLSAFQRKLDAVEARLGSLQGLSAGDIDATLNDLDAGRAHLALALAANSLLHAYLQLRGQQPETFAPYAKEHARLQLYVTKMNKVTASEELSKAKRTTHLNVEAVNRVISAVVSDPTHKAQLRNKAGTRGDASKRPRSEVASDVAKRRREEDAGDAVERGADGGGTGAPPVDVDAFLSEAVGQT